VHPEPMGEVRVPVRLVNSVDAVLQEEQSTGKLRAFDGVGVVDSGAVMLAVPAEVSEALGVRERAKVLVRLADESQLELAVAVRWISQSAGAPCPLRRPCCHLALRYSSAK
jgi:hypothetical protein